MNPAELVESVEKRSGQESVPLNVLWTICDIAAYLRVSVKTARKIVKMSGFPVPCQITGRELRFFPEEVEMFARNNRAQKTGGEK